MLSWVKHPQKQRTNGFQVGFVHPFIFCYKMNWCDLWPAGSKIPGPECHVDSKRQNDVAATKVQGKKIPWTHWSKSYDWHSMKGNVLILLGPIWEVHLVKSYRFSHSRLGLKDTGNHMKSPRQTQKSVQYLGLLVINNDLKPSRMSQALLILQKQQETCCAYQFDALPAMKK